MSLADLRDLADKLEGELAGRAREVSAPLAPFAEAPTVDALA
jgi:hypothetical protein